MTNYDLEERTAKFGENIIRFAKNIPDDSVYKRVIPQLVAAGTSVGANYMEANASSSKKDFRNKIYICKKEVQETKYWLRIIANTNESLKDDAHIFWQEAQELTLIFGKILSTLNNRNEVEN